MNPCHPFFVHARSLLGALALAALGLSAPLAWAGTNPSPQTSGATGACCFASAACEIVSEESCASDGGAYQGDGTACDPNPCGGACCDPSGFCSITTPAACSTGDGEYQGTGTLCAPSPCTQLYGACCASAFSCSITLESGCTGTWMGAGTSCDPWPCSDVLPIGACCSPDGSCSVLTEEACDDLGEDTVWFGETTDCDPSPCPQPCAGRAGANGSIPRYEPPARRGADPGPNAGGTLILHANPAIVYTTDPTNWCGQSGLSDCELAVSSSSSTLPTVLHVIAAFEPTSSPRLSGVTFGIDYGDCLSITQWGDCADFELEQAGWPLAGTGTAVTYNTARTTHLTEIYWFVCEQYAAPMPNELALIPHPIQGASFADDAIPSNVDDIQALGRFGFFQPGDAPCPVAVGACCAVDGACDLTTEDACAFSGGAYQGTGSDCNPNPCPIPPTGACCSPQGGCNVRFEFECGTDHVWLGAGTDCSPNPCNDNGACCSPDNTCTVTFVANCLAPSTWLGSGTDCSPNPCVTEPTGACCLVDETCIVTTESACPGASQWMGKGTACDPYPCPPLGACCYENGTCGYVYEAICEQNGGAYQGPSSVCEPNPCPVPSGRCCIGDECIVTSALECSDLDGVWHPDEDCEPNPCDHGVPLEKQSWGSIKSRFRR